MILQRRLTRPLSDLLETSGPFVAKRPSPSAGRRRLRFSFFADEPNQGSEVSDQQSGLDGDAAVAGFMTTDYCLLTQGLVAQLVRARA